MSTETSGGVTSKTILEEYNPIHQVFSSFSKEVGAEFPLDDQDYLSLIQAGLSMVPVFGDLISSCFGIIWGKFFPAEDKYVTKEAFEKRISKLYQDMEKKIGIALDAQAADWCNTKFKTLLKGGELFKEAINVYLATKKKGNYSGAEKIKVETFIVAHHAVFTKSLSDALIFFSSEKYVKFTIKLYLETAAIYLAFLKDTLVFGKDWGLPTVYLEGSFGVKSIQQKVHEATADVFKTYKLFIEIFNKDKNLAGKMPDWSILVATYLHGDMTLYPHSVHWLKRHKYDHGLTSFLLPKDIVQPHIFSIDATQVGIMCEGLTQIYTNKINGQTCNYVMNTYDYALVKGMERKKTLVYFTLYEEVQRTLAFRFYISNTQGNYNDFELTVRELDPEKVDQKEKPGYHPDDAFKIKLKEHKQKKMKNSKPFVSPYGNGNMDMYQSDPITLETSKIYYVEFISSSDINLGSYYHRVDIISGAAVTDKLAYEEGDRPMINVDLEEESSLIDFAKLGAEYDAAEAMFLANNAVGSVVSGVKGLFGK
ncbi:hypothetical protein DICPUDRAFT_93912 [Dictyostelium purpureum]|uniref:Pesticidal crystal protein domain-containing protein n=1 Tax=Dictyostelium purpureum TaxID=5786 RepID=F0ZDA0_DICPU|nr:uncharacterized protein DICPUDRAFT_93912 [Dictyostelium purpureum]EGC38101.1 hypothetical protein DICPUDRAFT_93912 [Dictyostelium purpureum]|eukprot:XP_003285408.1 hypothetical protein DICPUDRAFT_93912 [Dictyostelium purpureum]